MCIEYNIVIITIYTYQYDVLYSLYTGKQKAT